MVLYIQRFERSLSYITIQHAFQAFINRIIIGLFIG